ncbi:MAG: DUF4349 domain-containing protein [Planctomycetota bacterium]
MLKPALAVLGISAFLLVMIGCAPAGIAVQREGNGGAAFAVTESVDWPGTVTRNDNSTLFETRPGKGVTTKYAAPEPPPAAASIARRVIYTGGLTVLSPDPDGAIHAAKTIAEDAGGYVTSVKGQRVVLRVPAAKFDATMNALAELGLVTDRQIDAADVTEQMVDLEIRLDNLEALRKRMQALLEKADKVEDALKIEKELGRLTGEIESIKGRLRLLKDRVALSTITVTFNTPAGTASGLATRVRPFGWVNAVGSEAFGAARLPRAQAKLGKAPRLDLPDGFVRFSQENYRVFAIDRGQVVIKVTRQPNYDKADAGFWADQVRDRLTQDLGVPVSDPQRLTVDDANAGYVMTGNRPAGQDQLGYFVGLSANDKHVFLVEAWGPAKQVDAKHDELVRALKTLRVTRGWF